MRRIVKSLADWLALVLVLPAYLLYLAGRVAGGRDRAFVGWSQAFSLIPGISGEFLRRAFYRFTLTECGPDVSIGFGTTISHPTARLGARVYVGSYCVLGGVTLGDDVLVASGVSIMNGTRQHGTDRLDIPIREQTGVYEPVTIGRGTWIGERAVVAASVGRDCVVGAGAVVLRAVPDYAVVAGVPARVLRYRQAAGAPDATPTS